MSYTQQQIDSVREHNHKISCDETNLELNLRKVLDSPRYNRLCNYLKAGVLLKLEGEYDPKGFG